MKRGMKSVNKFKNQKIFLRADPEILLIGHGMSVLRCNNYAHGDHIFFQKQKVLLTQLLDFSKSQTSCNYHTSWSTIEKEMLASLA
jgi:hypothetical protein